MERDIYILAIETSCDETSAAVIHNGELLSNRVATQEIHKEYGGVVPEVASRAHQQMMIPVVMDALQIAGITTEQLSAIAYTKGPGLLGALLVGNSFAKGLALALNLPLIGVHHMKAHIWAHFIEEPKPQFPFLCLTVSGGHTQIVKVNAFNNMELLGETQDDAVGEAFDKAAKMIGLPYPGGPHLDKLAQSGNPKAFEFPIVDMPNYNYSFSGLKTSFLRFVQKNGNDFIQNNLADVAASMQHTLVQTLLKKLILASKETGIKQIAIAGGVSANSYLRKTLEDMATKRNWQVFIPAFQYCTDNAGMIAAAAYEQFLLNDFDDLSASPIVRWELHRQ